jgi:hypothetical protein
VMLRWSAQPAPEGSLHRCSLIHSSGPPLKKGIAILAWGSARVVSKRSAGYNARFPRRSCTTLQVQRRLLRKMGGSLPAHFFWLDGFQVCSWRVEESARNSA